MKRRKQTYISVHITEAEAKKRIEEMNLINGFLFDSALEDEKEAKIIVGSILKAVFNRTFRIVDVRSQKVFQAIDTHYHGIRLDAQITQEDEENELTATIFDVEMEDRPADKKVLPKRFRYYSGLHDVKKLEAGHGYDKLPDFVSITILSYDPFDAGDMYYEAHTVLTSHPEVEYNDGITHIYLYCNGNPNFAQENCTISFSAEHGQKLQEMLKYIVSGEKPEEDNADIDEIDRIVTKVKSRKGVTTSFMRQWDRELSIKLETKAEAKAEDALNFIQFCLKNNISEEKIRKELSEKYEYTPNEIDSLFDQSNITV